MTSNRLEEDLEIFDFSSCHDIKDRLYQQLLNMHRMENSAPGDHWESNKMEDEELDLATAAGNPALQKRKDNPRGDV